MASDSHLTTNPSLRDETPGNPGSPAGHDPMGPEERQRRAERMNPGPHDRGHHHSDDDAVEAPEGRTPMGDGTYEDDDLGVDDAESEGMVEHPDDRQPPRD